MAIEKPLDAQVRAQLQQLKGDDFQDFVARLQFALHGVHGFQALRRTHDKGSDGLITDVGCSIACYGPDDKTFKAFKKKVTGDYKSYAEHWKAAFPKWRVYINREPSPDELNLVAGLHPGALLFGVSSIMEELRALPWSKKLPLYAFLQIDSALIGRDFLQPILDDLISERIQSVAGNYDHLAPDFEAKLRVNYTPEEVDSAIALAQLTLDQQAAADAALSAYDDIELSRIKSRVALDFDQTAAIPSFSARVAHLKMQYDQKYNFGQDDGMRIYIHGLLMVLFAQCIFGVRP